MPYDFIPMGIDPAQPLQAEAPRSNAQWLAEALRQRPNIQAPAPPDPANMLRRMQAMRQPGQGGPRLLAEGPAPVAPSQGFDPLAFLRGFGG